MSKKDILKSLESGVSSLEVVAITIAIAVAVLEDFFENRNKTITKEMRC